MRLAVEEGEVAVPGTFSRETGLLMTIADLSVILAKVQVDETDVVRLKLRDSVEVTIDAYPDTTFSGPGEQGESQRQAHAHRNRLGLERPGGGLRRGDHAPESAADIRPDLSCTARIITDTRNNALSIPIIALTVREHEKIPNESEAEHRRSTPCGPGSGRRRRKACLSCATGSPPSVRSRSA